ncbi:MAG: hypothetical protein Q4D41_00575 [Prevotellaceae bacterium]|nr:hypothetical protein [Prevotellaceae bacterium]
MNRELNDSAFAELNKIDVSDLSDESDVAYYYLLKTQTDFRLYNPIDSDSLIDISVKYYERFSSDMEKLMRAYYYKGDILFERNEIDSAVVYMKKGEKLAVDLKDILMQHHFYESLSFANEKSGNNNMALKYAYLALDRARAIHRQEWIIECLITISAIYSNIGNTDSTSYYFKSVSDYADKASRNMQPKLYYNIAIFHYNNGRSHEAKEYVIKSLKIKPTPEAYSVLAHILLSEGDEKEAWRLFTLAMDSGTTDVKIESLQCMAEYKKEQGNYEEAAKLMDRINALKDTVIQAQKTDSILQLQNNIERKESEKMLNKRISFFVIVAVNLVVLLVIFAVYHAVKVRRAKRVIEESQKKIDKYTHEIESLDNSDKRNITEINRLKKKITDLREKQSTIIGHGKECLEEIMNGATTIKWNRSDFESVIEYYRTEHPDRVESIERRYNSLTAANIFFLLLPEIGVSDADVPRVMNMSAGAIRTYRYRLRNKEKK